MTEMTWISSAEHSGVWGDTVEIVPADRGDTAIRWNFFGDEIDPDFGNDMLTGEVKNT